MLLKKLYDSADPEPAKIRVPKVKLLHLGARQRFIVQDVLAGVIGGYVTLARGRVVIHGVAPGGGMNDVVYRIRRLPGLYCCHCGAKQNSSAAAQAHVLNHHAGELSPDKNNPSGYEQLNALDCERE